MKTEQLVLPIKCVNCNATFDLWHDLIADSEADINEIKKRGAGEHEHLCWKCRQKVMSFGPVFVEDVEEIEVEGEDAFELFWE